MQPQFQKQPHQQPPQAQPQFDLAYVNRPEVAEVFADSIGNVFVDGQTLRLEFLVHRLDEPKIGQNKITGKKITATRIVMPAKCIVEIYNQLQGLVTMMEQQGVVQRNAPTQVLDPSKPAGPLN